jgi:hypothetical protein
MATEHVVTYRDQDNGRELKLDINNGYLYDLSGNQVAKWDPIEGTGEEVDRIQMLADWASNRQKSVMRNALNAPQASAQSLAMLAKATGPGDVERLIQMDLGEGDVHIPAALPNFAGGYRQFAPVADAASPPLLVPKQTDKYFVFDKNDAYQVAAPILGGPAGQPQEIPPRLNNSQFYTTEYALGGFVATQLDAAADAPLRLDLATLKRVLNNLMIRREQRVANMLTNSANWNSTNVATIASGFQWDGGVNSDPIKDIHTRMEQSLGEITGMIMPEPTWHAFQRNPQVQKYFTYKQSAKPLPDAGQMSAILEIPPIYVARLKTFAPSGGALTFAWGNDVVLVRQPEQMPPTSQDDIATSYTFRWNATAPDGTSNGMAGSMGFASAGGMVIRKFFNQLRGTMGGNQVVCVHHDHEVMTSGFVGGLLINTYQ